ncbi:MAG: hypothetical protein LUO82_03325 [Methanomicrobiales archaeon]|nr:hypothetical protein [Methanomicrobiales archaeon]
MLRWCMVLIMMGLVIITGCLSEEQTPPKTPVTTISPISLTPTPPVTTPPQRVVLEGNRVILKDEQKNWELPIAAGRRVSVELVTDGAPVDLVILDASNYNMFSVAFSSRSGKLWDEYIVLRTGSTREKVEFKAPRSANYRIVIENADVIPGGAVTTRDVSVTIRVIALD